MARSSVASLLEENRQLRVQLERSDLARRRVEGQVTDLKRRVDHAEAAVRLKEGEWMAEYDRNVQALLKIIKHHEEEKLQLGVEVQKLRAAAGNVPSKITKMTRSTQTEVLRPTRALSRRNSVRFAKEEDDTRVEKEDSAYIEAKAKSNLVRMQRLFEQLQVSRDQHGMTVGRHNTIATNTILSIAREHAGNSLDSPKQDLKAAALERLQGTQTAASAVRRRSSVAATLNGVSKTSETQTDEAPAPRQETCSTNVEQDLKERNQLLHERLTTQQKVLDELLYTKLKHASDTALCGHSQNSLRISSEPVEECTVTDQADVRNKCDSHVPTTDQRVSLAQRSVIRIESADTTEWRPLSPPAA